MGEKERRREGGKKGSEEGGEGRGEKESNNVAEFFAKCTVFGCETERRG